MKQLFFILLTISLTACSLNYPTTTFYVKNTTIKTLNFKASIIKYSSMGPFEMTLPFSVPPNDSILARQTGFKKDAEPNKWFTKFTIFPTDSIIFNDPNNLNNWIKSVDSKGRPVYTFNIAK